MAAIKVVHTSDARLGKRFPHMDREAEALRSEDLFRVFSEMVNHAIRIEADLLLIAGDVFERVSAQRDTVSRALEMFARMHQALPDSRIVLTPGEDEIFVRKDGREDCVLAVFGHLPFVDVLGAGPEVDRRVYVFRGQEITVSSCSYDKFFDPDFKPRLIPAVKRGFGIFLLHAFSRRAGVEALSDEDFKLKILDAPASRGYGYCALGHGGAMKIIEHKELTAAYPGSLERLNPETDRGRKSFITFTIGDEKMGKIEPVRCGVRPIEYLTVNCSLGEDKLENLLTDTLQRGGKEKILFIALEGQLEFEHFNKFRRSDTLKQLREKFAIVHIDNRLVLVDGQSGYDFNTLRVGTPIEEFRRYMEREMEQAKPGTDERAILDELYRMGIKELEQEL